MTSPRTVEAAAPAKLNLTLHVTGRRADGYHLLDSLVVFAAIGDRVTIDAAPEPGFRVTGPMAAGVPEDGSNLVRRAAALFDPPVRAVITLHKRLPMAAGLGGGSADAAAGLRALAEVSGRPLPPRDAILALGADIPVCLAGRPCRMQGIGDAISPGPCLPPVWVVLANPGEALATDAVFAGLACRENAPMPHVPQRFATLAALADWLAVQRNDLAAAAQALCPPVGAVLTALRADPDCLMARMSGSGATCFGLFGNAGAAERCAKVLRRREPDWWVAATPLLGPPA